MNIVKILISEFPIIRYGIIGFAALIVFRIALAAWYKKSSYYKLTHIPLHAVVNDAGKFGEFSIFYRLRRLEGENGRFLFNVYLPKPDGSTSELDVVLVSDKGIFVFESKNYSGWIFGRENQTYWTQTLPAGKGSQKHKFYNPIHQNQKHVNILRNIIGHDIPIYSVIVFSNRCTFKSLEIYSPDVAIVHLDMLHQTVWDIANSCNMTIDERTINDIYELLYPMTQLSEEEKQQHVDNIYHCNRSHSDRVHLQTHDSSASFCPLCGQPLIILQMGDGSLYKTCDRHPEIRFDI